MIARVSGTVWDLGQNHVLVQVGGVGLRVLTPATVLGQMGLGEPVEMYTHLHVRENDLTLYGFLTQEALDLFTMLLGVSGVGPKVALALLGTISPDTLRQAIAREEPGLLSSVPGIGPKTAKGIIFHLKDKLGPAAAEPAPLLDDDDAQVIAALTGLGFSLIEAQSALQNVPQEADQSIEERVRQALAYFAAP